MIREYDGVAFHLQVNSNEENQREWFFANTDFLFVDIPEFHECHDGWQKYGEHCWLDEISAFKVLVAIKKKYPEFKFRMAKVEMKFKILGYVTSE